MLTRFIIPHSSLYITVFAIHFKNLIAVKDAGLTAESITMESIRAMLNHSEGHARKHSTRQEYSKYFKQSRPEYREAGAMENRTQHDSDQFPHTGFRRQSFALHEMLKDPKEGKRILDRLNTKNEFRGCVTLQAKEECVGVRQFKKSSDEWKFKSDRAYLDIRKDTNGNLYVLTFFPKSLNE